MAVVNTTLAEYIVPVMIMNRKTVSGGLYRYPQSRTKIPQQTMEIRVSPILYRSVVGFLRRGTTMSLTKIELQHSR